MIRAQATEGMKAKDVSGLVSIVDSCCKLRIALCRSKCWSCVLCSQELESQLKEARLKASQANDQSAALADLQQKLELSEARNKKLLSEMAQLHQEKLEIEKLFASAKEEIEELRAMRSEDEKSTKYVGEMLMKELTDMDKAIHDAANRIEVMFLRGYSPRQLLYSQCIFLGMFRRWWPLQSKRTRVSS